MQTSNQLVSSKKVKNDYTEYQLHKSQISNGFEKNIFDYTEYRFLKYIENFDKEKQVILLNVLISYRKGTVAIAWKAGHPVWISVNKG